MFQIALIDRVSHQKVDYFDHTTKNIITYTLWDHLVRIAQATPGSFIPGPSWSLRAEHLKAHDVVVHFVLDPSQSVAARMSVPAPQGSSSGGFTATTSRGVVSEVYVDGNMPARRLANIAFHEIMHIKLDVGHRAVSDIHRPAAGGGLAQTPTNEWTQLTAANIQLMAANLFRGVRQYTGAMQL
jgi:hypothetical protein